MIDDLLYFWSVLGSIGFLIFCAAGFIWVLVKGYPKYKPESVRKWEEGGDVYDVIPREVWWGLLWFFAVVLGSVAIVGTFVIVTGG